MIRKTAVKVLYMVPAPRHKVVNEQGPVSVGCHFARILGAFLVLLLSQFA
jgi:hypothetical protein